MGFGVTIVIRKSRQIVKLIKETLHKMYFSRYHCNSLQDTHKSLSKIKSKPYSCAYQPVFFFSCHSWSTSLNTGILLWFFNSVLCSLLKQLISKILISSMTSLKNFNIYVCTCQFVCTCVEVRRQSCIFCCCVYHPGSQAFWGFFCLCLSPSSKERQDYRWVLSHTAFTWVWAFKVRSSWTHGKNPLPRTFFII